MLKKGMLKTKTEQAQDATKTTQISAFFLYFYFFLYYLEAILLLWVFLQQLNTA